MTEVELKKRLSVLVMKGHGFAIEDSIAREAEFLADKFAEKEAEKRWLVVCGGLFIFFVACAAFWR